MDITLNTSPKWKRILCLVFLFFYCTGISGDTRFSSSILYLLYPIVMFTLVFLMIPELFRETKKFKGNLLHLLLIPLGFLLLIVCQEFVCGCIIDYVTTKAGIDLNDANADNFAEKIKVNPVFYVFGGCIYGPILEELLYRYTFFGIIYPKNRTLAYVLPALAFGLQHVIEAAIWNGNVVQFFNIPEYIVAGLIYELLYSKTKNLWIPIGAHIIFNSLSVYYMMTH